MGPRSNFHTLRGCLVIFGCAPTLHGCVNEHHDRHPVAGSCEADTDGPPPIGGAWSEQVEDWHDPGADGNDVLPAVLQP